MTKIFLIEEEYNTGHEDNSGRDIYESSVNPDYGYFTDEEEAYEFITRLAASEEKEWTERVAKAERDQREADEQHAREVDELRRKADEAGIPMKNVVLPTKKRFYKPYRSITRRCVVECEPAEVKA